MNASAQKWRPYADRREHPLAMIVVVLVLGGGALGGCADVHRATFLPPVNPESPVAAAVAAAAMHSYKQPSFASVPPKPINVPPPSLVKGEVIDMVRCRRAYETWAAANPALVSGTGAFAQGLQAQLDNAPEDRPTPAQNAATEAEVAKLRAYAEPPPPMHPGPPLSASDAASPGAVAAQKPSPRPGRPAVKAQAASTSSSAAPAAPVASTSEPAPASAPQTVAVVQPSRTPVSSDPLLARCQ